MEQKLYELNEKATEIYHRELYRSYNTALSYFSKRHIRLNTIEAFRLGYAGGLYNLYEYLKCEGFNDDVIIASGLVKRQEDGNIIESYRNRIVFPIINEENQVIAFGARVLDNRKPKYINSPETIIYSKGRSLYGINIAKDNVEDGIILVEGYIDVIILNQVGIKNVVALLGTAITDEQIKIIKRYTNKVIIAFDSDLAGTKAVLITQEKFKKYNIECLSIKLDNAKDVDEYINKNGVEKFRTLLNG